MNNNFTLDDIEITLNNNFCLTLLKVEAYNLKKYPHIYFNHKGLSEGDKIVKAYINTLEQNEIRVLAVNHTNIKNISYDNIDYFVINKVDTFENNKEAQESLIEIINYTQKEKLPILLCGNKEIEEYNFNELLKSKLAYGVVVRIDDEDIL